MRLLVQLVKVDRTKLQMMAMLLCTVIFATMLTIVSSVGSDGPLGEVAGVLGLDVEPAAASADSCTWAPSGANCVYVNGSGTYVNYIRASRWNYTGGQVCGHAAWTFLIYPNGSVSGLSWLETSRCTWAVDSHVTYVQKHLPRGTRVCTKVYSYGAQQGGNPCITIR